ncbi:MAG: GNAT family N-acetyltransferase [Candidatus Acidiferrales bacterium]
MNAQGIPLRIRAATPTDVPALARLAGQLGYPTTPEEAVHRIAADREDSRHELLVAETNSEVIGWMSLAEEHSILHEPRVEILGLVVDETHRGAAVGRKLIERAEQWARERGCKTILLRSNVVRERAHHFYERLGYGVVKTQKVFRKPL